MRPEQLIRGEYHGYIGRFWQEIRTVTIAHRYGTGLPVSDARRPADRRASADRYPCICGHYLGDRGCFVSRECLCDRDIHVLWTGAIAESGKARSHVGDGECPQNGPHWFFYHSMGAGRRGDVSLRRHDDDRLDKRIALIVMSHIGVKSNRLVVGVIFVGFLLSFFVPSTTARVPAWSRSSSVSSALSVLRRGVPLRASS